MLDLSEESKEDNIADCVKYFTRMAKMNRKSILGYRRPFG
jgi:fructose-bisphosphate aldolase class II